MNADRIEKKILLHATRDRVWHAISDSHEFRTWFGAAFDGPFTERTRLTGKIVPTAVDAETAKLQEPDVDYSNEPTTLIVFEINEVADNTLLTISESGFDQLPIARRAKAFAANDGGWAMQTKLIEKYLAAHSAV
jgi:uncharacterized protein YndB with AHSA1/START domain